MTVEITAQGHIRVNYKFSGIPEAIVEFTTIEDLNAWRKHFTTLQPGTVSMNDVILVSKMKIHEILGPEFDIPELK